MGFHNFSFLWDDDKHKRIACKDYPIQNACFLNFSLKRKRACIVHVRMQAHALIVPSMHTKGQKFVHFADVTWRSQSLFLVNCTFDSVEVEKNESQFCY